MLSSSFPKRLPVPFADSGEKQVIPTPSQIAIEGGRASYTDGFPPLTRTPISAGGIPPWGTDFNGVLNDITQAIRWYNSGMQYSFDSAFSASVGGYPKGAILLKSSLSGLWQNSTENNTSNPDSGGAGWTDLTSGRLINVRTFTSSTAYTPTPGTAFIIVEVQGAGGAGAGILATSSSQSAVGGGGGSGAYSKHLIRSGFSGVTINVGVGGSAGGAGGASSFGSFVICQGGAGGPYQSAAPSFPFAGTGAAGADSPVVGNIIKAAGTRGGFGMITDNTGQINISGSGANSIIGLGGGGVGSTQPGAIGGYGAGGSGVCITGSGSQRNGGRGGDGVVIIWEYS
ncbi:hypothetical protein F0336_14010 [Serratia liquefaciens]|uniref:hypothetical protein n=1 Tax=Serratia liquefaciens TaxID=614 RepID=UPI0011F368AE|nr:hypothetical protein [Serratia liquefaciens]QIC87498.1 hypothetical protein F0336_14010 [Serratia liquefaciens]